MASLNAFAETMAALRESTGFDYFFIVLSVLLVAFAACELALRCGKNCKTLKLQKKSYDNQVNWMFKQDDFEQRLRTVEQHPNLV